MKKKFPLILAACLILAALGMILGFIVRTSKDTLQDMDASHTNSVGQANRLHEILHPEDFEGLIEDNSPDEEEPGTDDLEFLFEETEPDLAVSEEVPSEKTAITNTAHHIIFVGDSRTVGAGKAEAALGDNCIYIGESGEGYRWFTETGIDLLDEAIHQYPDSPVVYNLGVNDCDAIDSYIEVYRELEASYPDQTFYYMSVNPVTEESEHVPDSDVQAFNEKLRAAFAQQYIDTYTWMTTYGFVSVDGVHYSEAQYCAIHDYAAAVIFDLPLPDPVSPEDETDEAF